MWGDGVPVGRRDAAQVDHALDAGGARGVGEVLGRAAVAAGEVVVAVSRRASIEWTR